MPSALFVEKPHTIPFVDVPRKQTSSYHTSRANFQVNATTAKLTDLSK